MRIAKQTNADVVVLGGMGLVFDAFQTFVEELSSSAALSKSVLFIHTPVDPVAECLLVPELALLAAEHFAFQGKHVLVLLTDMSAYADALKEIAISMDQIPSTRGYPGSLYSDLAARYERAIELSSGGSITLVTVTTMPGGDITHPIPDNTGYITEGQFFLENGRIDPFSSLSRLKQLVIGHATREDHGEIANVTVRLLASARQSKEKMSMGFELSPWDKKLLLFAERFDQELLPLEVDLPLEQALDLLWDILSAIFSPQEAGIKFSLVEKFRPHWKEAV
ncbi:V-type ATP synthase subunit B [Candidatus Similichlamydia laticola]|uniref:V-type ATP synthase subunit B n=2 Tax=Candidatus Similichlamydia laticola TaxID=2170265 RepID=A0A369KFY4_9BACT|nr:V-type ATP synthase subunit B [Candidatus Similichlamydia laticola]